AQGWLTAGRLGQQAARRWRIAEAAFHPGRRTPGRWPGWPQAGWRTRREEAGRDTGPPRWQARWRTLGRRLAARWYPWPAGRRHPWRRQPGWRREAPGRQQAPG